MMRKPIVGAFVLLISFSACKDSTLPCVSDGVADPEYRLGTRDPGTSPTATFPETGVQDRCGAPVAYRIVSDGSITVAGTAVGSVEARTVTWDKATLIPPGAPSSAWHELELHDANGTLVGRMGYRLYDIGASGEIRWGAWGVNITPIIPPP